MRNNKLDNNFFAFDTEFIFNQAVFDNDSSNTVDGMPVYYWINQQNKVVPIDAGYVLLDNCRNILVQCLSIPQNLINAKHNQCGINLVSTSDSVIDNNVLSVGTGIAVLFGHNINISRNTLNTGGIYVDASALITDNSISVSGTYWSMGTPTNAGISLNGFNPR